MIKVTTKYRDKYNCRSRTKINCRGKRALLEETFGTIISLCTAVSKSLPGLTPAELLEMAAHAMKCAESGDTPDTEEGHE